jgi:membrane protein YqaA with SNARE-associated domain
VPGHDCLLAYLGLGPEQQFIPYFLALLAWVGAMFGAVLQWPIAALLRRFRRARGKRKEELTNQPQPANLPESPGEG